MTATTRRRALALLAGAPLLPAAVAAAARCGAAKLGPRYTWRSTPGTTVLGVDWGTQPPTLSIWTPMPPGIARFVCGEEDTPT